MGTDTPHLIRPVTSTSPKRHNYLLLNAIRRELFFRTSIYSVAYQRLSAAAEVLERMLAA